MNWDGVRCMEWGSGCGLVGSDGVRTVRLSGVGGCFNSTAASQVCNDFIIRFKITQHIS